MVWVILSGNQKKWVTKASGNNETNIPHYTGQNGCNDTQAVWSFYATWGSCPCLQRDSESYQEMPLIMPKKGRYFAISARPISNNLLTEGFIPYKRIPRAILMGQMFNILLPQRSKWWTLILLQCPDTLTLTPGKSFLLLSYFHCHRWSRSAASSNGCNSSTGLSRLACWSWWQSYCLQLPRKINICSGYLNSEKKSPGKPLQGLFNGA